MKNYTGRKSPSRPRQIWAVLCLLGVLYFMSPLVIGKFHTGMWLPSMILLCLAFPAALPKQAEALFTGRYRPFGWIAAIGLALGILLMAGLFVLMGLAAGNRPPETGKVTVVVLGCQVVGDTPGVMLQGRIDAAYAYLKENPDAVCIASGGRGTGENISEAEAIRRALVQKGIDPTRIYLEEQSTNTYENIGFSARVIEENGLPRTIVAATDNFHQLRTALHARNNGLESYAAGCPSPWTVGPGYWVRESVAVVRTILLERQGMPE